MEDTYAEVLEKRFTVAMALDMMRGYDGEELIEQTVDRYRVDEDVMEFYDQDVDALRSDIEYVRDHLSDPVKEIIIRES